MVGDGMEGEGREGLVNKEREGGMGDGKGGKDGKG